MLTHPVQYFSPLFNELARRTELEFHVLYGSQYGLDVVKNSIYGEKFKWDIDFTNGHEHIFCHNPGGRYSRGFNGIPAVDLAERLRKLAPELLVVNGYDTSYDWRGLFWAARRRVPVVARPEFGSGASGYPWWKRTIGKGAKAVFFPLLSGGLACSSYAEQRLRNKLGIKPVFRCTYCVDNEFFKEGSEDANVAEERREWSVPREAFVLLFVGRFVPLKRLDDAIKIIQRSLGDHKQNPWHLVLVGDGPLRETLRAFSRKLGVMDRVHFIGFRNQQRLPRVYAASDIVLLLSERETWGMSVNEGMAAGRPAVVSDKCACTPDLVIPGKTGATFPVGDTELLYQAIERVQAIRARLGEQARRHVVENHNASVAVEGVVSCAQALCRQ